MSDSELVAGYRAELATRLPDRIVDELADGLTDTYHHHLDRGLGRAEAARAALAEFGDPDTVTTAFVNASPSRRIARHLLATSPLVGAAWAAVLLTAHAWAWPVPVTSRLLFGVLVLTVAATLASAARAHHYQRARHLTVGGCVGVLVLDVALLAYVTTNPIPMPWPIVLAAPISTARIAFAIRALRPVLAH